MLSNVSYIWHPRGYQLHRAHYSAVMPAGGSEEKECRRLAANVCMSRQLSPFHCPHHIRPRLGKKVLTSVIVDRLVLKGFGFPNVNLSVNLTEPGWKTMPLLLVLTASPQTS